MIYVELAVQISPGAPGRYDVRVASDQGEGKSNFALPFELQDLYGTVHGVRAPAPSKSPAEATPAGAAPAAPADPPPPPPAAPAAFGRKLFQALFQGEARDVLSRTESQARGLPDGGVRIRLTMDLQDPGMAEVASLPWELMCRDDGSPVVVSTDSTIVRALDTPRPVIVRPFSGPLRILALKSNPEGTAKLDLQKEIDAVGVSWAQLDGVQVDFVRPTQSAILKQLASAEYHVVHYMGHGGFNPEAGGGRLLLEDEDGALRRVPADVFAAWLADEPLRLVFLNACETARTTDRTELPPFAGVATALIRAGIPAVVGMQFPVTDWAAITFAHTFYERIVQGFPVDAAAAEGRKALYGPSPVEWATPVLFMRSHDGDLFPRAAGAATAVGAPEPPRAVPMAAAAAAPAPVMQPASTPISNRSISIGGSVSGSVVQTGDHNVTTLTTTTLPAPESVDIAAVMQELRTLIAQTQVAADNKASRKVSNALEEVDDEIASPAPNKEDAADALTRAVGVMAQATDFGEQAAKLAPLLISAASWLGGHLAGPLLALVGLAV